MAEEKKVTRRATHFVREGDFGADVEVELIDAEGGWSPYVSIDDAKKLERVHHALRRGDLQQAARLADRVYRLMPVEA